MSFTRLVLSLGSLAIVLTAASGARAQQCDAKVLCPKGFVCEISATPTAPPTAPGARTRQRWRRTWRWGSP